MERVSHRFLDRRWLIGLVLVAIAVVTYPQRAFATPLLLNGDFEAGGGSFTGWTVVNQAGGSGNWLIQTGTTSPISGFGVPSPPGPTHAAMTDQTGPGSHVLFQDFVVPADLSSANLSFDLFLGNRDGAFDTPASLDYTVVPNQQARIDILTSTANPFSVTASDVLLSLYQTHSGDPLVSGYTLETFDLLAFLSAHSGQTLTLRFAETDNQNFFQMGVDLVNLDVTESAVPEPATLTLTALGLAGILRRVRRRRAAR